MARLRNAPSPEARWRREPFKRRLLRLASRERGPLEPLRLRAP
jgi:hypothetical protein